MKQKKEKRITLRVTPEQYETIQAKAETAHMSTGADPVKDGTTMHQYSDRKNLRKEMRKKIAMGHKEDDHEEEQRWEQSM